MQLSTANQERPLHLHLHTWSMSELLCVLRQICMLSCRLAMTGCCMYHLFACSTILTFLTRLPDPVGFDFVPYGAHLERDYAKLLCSIGPPPSADAKAVWRLHAACQTSCQALLPASALLLQSTQYTSHQLLHANSSSITPLHKTGQKAKSPWCQA